MENIVEVLVPDIGDFKDVDVIEVTAEVGHIVEIDDPLITLESDKATMEVPTTHAGRITAMHVAVGDKVSAGSQVATLEAGIADTGKSVAPEVSVAAVAPDDEEPPPEAAARPAAPLPAPRPAPTAGMEDQEIKPAARGHATPSARRFARELGVDLTRVNGTGRKGRILKEDIQRYVKDTMAQPPAPAGGAFALPEMPEVDFAKFGEIEIQPLSRIKKLSGAHLRRCWLHIPHVTQHDEADITELEAFRQELREEASTRGVRITLLAFLLKAATAALKTHRAFNASLDPSGENLILKNYYHIGVAVDTPEGLVVPVVRDVDQKSLFELATELTELSGKARDKQLLPGDMQGGAFTISSLGGIGGTAFTPIVNAPEVAILGVSRSTIKPVYRNGEFVPRLMLPLSLSYDHRVVDGAAAARFTSYLSSVLSDIRRLLL